MTARQSLVAAATAIAGSAAAYAARADETGDLSHEVRRAVIDAGFARHFVADGAGAAGSHVELLRAVSILGQGCASTAWFASLAAALGRIAGYLPHDGYERVYADGPDTLVVGSLVSCGTAVAAPGGWLVSGRWPYVSAVEYAEWALLAGNVAVLDRSPEARVFAVPRVACDVERDWAALGMRATASHTVSLDGLFVPDAMSFTRDDVERAVPRNGPPRVNVPHRAVTGLSFAAPALGVARGALDRWVHRLADRRGPHGFPSATEWVGHSTTVARAAAELDAAELLLERVAAAADGGEVDRATVERGARDCAYATELVVSAAERVVKSAGTPALSRGDPLERAWRDVMTAASHGTLRFVTKATAYADALFDARDERRRTRPDDVSVRTGDRHVVGHQ